MQANAAEHITWKNLSSGYVLLNLDSGEYYALNETASAIWKGFIEQQSNGDIANTLCKDFDCDLEQSNQDILDFFDYLAEEKLIVKT